MITAIVNADQAIDLLTRNGMDAADARGALLYAGMRGEYRSRTYLIGADPDSDLYEVRIIR
jgi:hypothetical protein